MLGEDPLGKQKKGKVLPPDHDAQKKYAQSRLKSKARPGMGHKNAERDVTMAPEPSSSEAWFCAPHEEGMLVCMSGDRACSDLVFQNRRALSSHLQRTRGWRGPRRAQVTEARCPVEFGGCGRGFHARNGIHDARRHWQGDMNQVEWQPRYVTTKNAAPRAASGAPRALRPLPRRRRGLTAT